MAENPDAGTGPEPEETELREITAVELQFILNLHRAWVITNKTQGERADLAHVNLYEAHLEGANLYGAHLEGAYLEEADLGGADLEEANLALANLRRAHLGMARNLIQAQLDAAFGDEYTKLPDGLTIKQKGSGILDLLFRR